MQCLALVERQFAAATHWAAWETVRETSRHERQNPDADYGETCIVALPGKHIQVSSPKNIPHVTLTDNKPTAASRMRILDDNRVSASDVSYVQGYASPGEPGLG